LSVAEQRAPTLQMGTIVGRDLEMTQGRLGPVDRWRRMSVINAPRPLATGIDTAILGLRKAQERLGEAAFYVTRQEAVPSESSTKEGQKIKSPAQTPPNPGPPGGAVPGDLAQAMIAQSRVNKASVRPTDPAQAMVAQKLASQDIGANTKTVQAFDAMLEELSRLKQTRPSNQTK
jgi:hypothetical protein